MPGNYCQEIFDNFCDLNEFPWHARFVMVKSKLFQRLDEAEHPRMRDDLGVVLALPDETLAALVRQLPDLQSANRRSFEEILNKLREEFADLPIDRVVTVLLWFGKYATIHPFSKDPSESWVNDMIELGIAKGEQKDRGIEIVDRIRTEFTADETRLKLSRQRAQEGILPRFVDADMTVELRAMFDSDFSLGNGSATNYSPNIIGVVPILTLQVELDTGDPDRFHLQLTREDLKDFISILSAADKQLEQAAAASLSFHNHKKEA